MKQLNPNERMSGRFILATKRDFYKFPPSVDFKKDRGTTVVPLLLMDTKQWLSSGVVAFPPFRPGFEMTVPYENIAVIEEPYVPDERLKGAFFACPPAAITTKHLLLSLGLSNGMLFPIDEHSIYDVSRLSQAAGFMRGKKIYAKPTGCAKGYGLLRIDNSEPGKVRFDSEDEDLLAAVEKVFGSKNEFPGEVDTPFAFCLYIALFNWKEQFKQKVGIAEELAMDFLLEEDKGLLMLEGKKMEARVVVQNREGALRMAGHYVKIGSGDVGATASRGGCFAHTGIALAGLAKEHGLSLDLDDMVDKIVDTVASALDGFIEIVSEPAGHLSRFFRIGPEQAGLYVPAGRFAMLLASVDLAFTQSEGTIKPIVMEFNASSNFDISGLHAVHPEIYDAVIKQHINNLAILYLQNERL